MGKSHDQRHVCAATRPRRSRDRARSSAPATLVGARTAAIALYGNTTRAKGADMESGAIETVPSGPCEGWSLPTDGHSYPPSGVYRASGIVAGWQQAGLAEHSLRRF